MRRDRGGRAGRGHYNFTLPSASVIFHSRKKKVNKTRLNAVRVQNDANVSHSVPEQQ